jgi:DNA-binding NarL/FixJ family response regulator
MRSVEVLHGRTAEPDTAAAAFDESARGFARAAVERSVSAARGARRMAAGPQNPLSHSALDDEQRRLLALLGRGLSVTEAATQLRLSPRTAERRLSEARAALGAATNAEAVLRAEGHEIGVQSDGLSARECEVVQLVAAGLRDDEIADRLGIARSTVATLLRSAMAKLDARTRVEAVVKLAGIEDETRPETH